MSVRPDLAQQITETRGSLPDWKNLEGGLLSAAAALGCEALVSEKAEERKEWLLQAMR